ncbi:MAG: DUF4984 domain-containing protein [Alistipes sp.]|nr:DUF4984 domain-containing protein [Alistipes sp.]
MKHFFTNLLTTLALLMVLIIIGCEKEKPTYEGPNFVTFSKTSHMFGVLSDDEWFEVPVTASHPSDKDRNIGVEVIVSESSAIEDMHYTMESHTLTIKAGELTTAVRIKGISEAITPNYPVEIKLSLVLNEEDMLDSSNTVTTVVLQRCCPFDINNFAGYAVLTSTWSMQYMNVDSRLVRTHSDTEEGVFVIEDMFYENYDIRVKLHTDDRLNPIATLAGAQVVGSTGEAFGTIYGNGKLMMDAPSESVSYYSTCEQFLLLYSVMYVEEVGTVGDYVNILEWISDEEAERIMREGF